MTVILKSRDWHNLPKAEIQYFYSARRSINNLEKINQKKPHWILLTIKNIWLSKTNSSFEVWKFRLCMISYVMQQHDNPIIIVYFQWPLLHNTPLSSVKPLFSTHEKQLLLISNIRLSLISVHSKFESSTWNCLAVYNKQMNKIFLIIYIDLIIYFQDKVRRRQW